MVAFIDMTSQKFNYLTVIDIAYRKNTKVYWNCVCECGTRTIIAGQSLRNNVTQSCGCLRQGLYNPPYKKDITGKKYGDLIVISYSHTRNKAKFWLCKCICGISKPVPTSSLLSGAVKSCGNCRLRQNGQLCSRTQLKLATIFNSILGKKTIVNFKTKNKYIDIVFSYKGQKIGVEYDSWYFHGTDKRQQEDRIRRDLLINAGWKILSIRSRFKLPTEEELMSAIDELSHQNKMSFTITLPDWGKGRVFQHL
jgi:very-short-patch-repair endonuclease